MGKTVQRKPKSIVEEYAAVPKELVSRHKFISMEADVFFVDGIAFLLIAEIKNKFVTVEHTPVRTAKSIFKYIKRVQQVYNRVGFTVRYIIMDGEFEKVKDLLPTIVCNTTATKENVAEAERNIRVVKERNRGVVNTLLFTYIQ